MLGMRVWSIAVAAAALAVAGCGDGVSPRGQGSVEAVGAAEKGPVNYELETVAEGLDLPWSVAFLPTAVGGGVLITERPGAVKHVSPEGAVSEILDFADLEDAPVYTRDGFQAGLFEVSLHPQFETNRLVYFSYAGQVGETDSTLMVTRFRLTPGAAGAPPQLTQPERIFAASPARFSGNHYGGRIAWGSDGTLLIPHGEAFHFREEAQKLDNHFGKLIRIRDDGSIPPDNPFVGQDGALPEIYSYGHRNPQGILRAADGRILMHEHGPAGGDEINVIEAGGNYGWPVVSYGLDYSGARISPFEALDETAQPLLHFTPSIAPSGFAQYAGDAFPEWRGDLFLSALVNGHIRHIDVTPDGRLGEQRELFSELEARFRDVRAGPDGFLYLLIEDTSGPNGRLVRAKPSGRS
ncbi:MAG: PQQ-dependent sugar dehydrogenase [Pseudomonadota bacterium]